MVPAPALAVELLQFAQYKKLCFATTLGTDNSNNNILPVILVYKIVMAQQMSCARNRGVSL